MFRRFVLIGLVLVPALLAPATASASDAPERRALELVNATRTRHDLRTVRASARLMRYAERHARAMATNQRLFHSSLGLDGFSALGECVGEGGSVRLVHRAFLASSTHREIILGRWRKVGIGVVGRNGIRYVTEVFAR